MDRKILTELFPHGNPSFIPDKDWEIIKFISELMNHTFRLTSPSRALVANVHGVTVEHVYQCERITRFFFGLLRQHEQTCAFVEQHKDEHGSPAWIAHNLYLMTTQLSTGAPPSWQTVTRHRFYL